VLNRSARLLLDELPEILGDELDVDHRLRLQLFRPLVDLGLNRRSSIEVGRHREESLHRPERFVTASRSASGVLRGVLHPAIQPEVLSDPVVHEPGDVLQQALVVLSAAALHREAGLEGEEHLAVDRPFLLVAPVLGLGHRAVERAVVAEHREHCLEDRFALSHGHLRGYYVVGTSTSLRISVCTFGSFVQRDICSVLATRWPRRS